VGAEGGVAQNSVACLGVRAWKHTYIKRSFFWCVTLAPERDGILIREILFN